MKLSYRWLDALLPLGGLPPAEVARLLTFHTAPVGGVTEVGAGLGGVVSARVLRVRPHPNADRLRLCVVDLGDGTAPEVVCGAANVAEGQVVCFAREGITLPNGLTLTRRKIRGVESAGMICSEDELGLGTDHTGILVLPAGTPVGLLVGDVLGAHDHVLEIDNPDLTHRPDLWGHVGVARDLGAVLGKPFSPPTTARADAALAAAVGEPFPVEIEDPEGCRRYVGIVVEGVANAPSPAPIRHRLATLGVRSIGLLVDLTNLVMLEQGQPLHAFDLRDLGGGRIVVRRARSGETLRTLDSQERRLDPVDLVIADGERAVAVAGVMGGEDGGVRPDTTAILLEAANFDPVRVRRTASRLGLRTEASTRFEKALDPEAAERSARRFLDLLLEHQPNARVTRRISDAYPRPLPRRRLSLPYELPIRRLGFRVSDTEVRASLLALGFGVTETSDALLVDVPSWRATKDVTCPEDLVEEVGRVHGYADVPLQAPVGALVPRRPPPLRRLERRLSATLSLDLGYAETKGYSFYGAKDAERLGIADLPHLRVRNPKTEEQDRLALTAAAGLLRGAAKNVSHAPAGRMWESTRLTVPRTRSAGLPEEVRTLALVSWDREAAADPGGRVFLGLLEDLRALLAAAPVDGVEVRDAKDEVLAPGLPLPVWLHPGRRAVAIAGGRVLAVAGEVAPAVLRGFDLPGRAAVAEIALEAVLSTLAPLGGGYRPVHRYPVVPFDVAVVVPRETPAASVGAVIAGVGPTQIREVRVFDAYEGKGIPEGYRSLAFTCELLDPAGTLSTAGADLLRRRIRLALEEKGWTVRAGDPPPTA